MAQIRDSYAADDAANSLSGVLLGWLHDVKIQDLFVTCLSCKHLGDGGMSCKKFPGYPIPAHVVLTGCPDHEDNEPRRPPVAPHRSLTGQNYLDDDIPF